MNFCEYWYHLDQSVYWKAQAERQGHVSDQMVDLATYISCGLWVLSQQPLTKMIQATWLTGLEELSQFTKGTWPLQ